MKSCARRAKLESERIDITAPDPADGKGFDNPLVSPLHRYGIFFIKRTFMLINHDSVLLQGFIAIAIKFLGEKTFTRSEWVS
ncbi:hypothetical protein SDC9_171445 [bioreactor metagenome]|uniref:Uncharacterized protein n=1 Tax=bioreactor metagenome TaxID=1076179 RepID=A0A645GAX3_9ZZZZ